MGLLVIYGRSSTVEHQIPNLKMYKLATKRTFEPVGLTVAFGSLAELNDNPKAAADEW